MTIFNVVLSLLKIRRVWTFALNEEKKIEVYNFSGSFSFLVFYGIKILPSPPLVVVPRSLSTMRIRKKRARRGEKIDRKGK